ncbi:hypothetical protein BGZ90_000745 [Linnemannia elongata]|nr:hypothetical protein BGZ90_000745 [Linnemannia elongata]
MYTVSFDNLPYELQTMIIYLDQHEMAPCIRVCQSLNILLTPVLWRHVEDQTGPLRDKQAGCGSWLEAHNIVTSDWIRLNLEVLACLIRRIPRPELTDDMTFYTHDGR